jgi:hypothetical protein
LKYLGSSSALKRRFCQPVMTGRFCRCGTGTTEKPSPVRYCAFFKEVSVLAQEAPLSEDIAHPPRRLLAVGRSELTLRPRLSMRRLSPGSAQGSAMGVCGLVMQRRSFSPAELPQGGPLDLALKYVATLFGSAGSDYLYRLTGTHVGISKQGYYRSLKITLRSFSTSLCSIPRPRKSSFVQ